MFTFKSNQIYVSLVCVIDQMLIKLIREIDLGKKILDDIKSHGMLLVDPDKPFTRQQKKFYMEIASLSATERSDNPDYKVTYKKFVSNQMLLQVGACVVASSGHIISVGFNARPDSMIIANKQDMKKKSKES